MAACGSDTAPAEKRDPPAAAAAAEEARAGSLALRLREEGGKCIVLAAAGERHETALGSPCFFLRRNGQVQQYAYPKAGVDAVLIVAGGAITEAERAHWRIEGAGACANRAQAILVSGATARLARAPLTGGIFCREHGLDEKEFALAAAAGR